jgi:hypothetical protein
MPIPNQQVYAAALSARIKTSERSFIIIECDVDLHERARDVLVNISNMRVDSLAIPGSAVAAAVLRAAGDYILSSAEQEGEET